MATPARTLAVPALPTTAGGGNLLRDTLTLYRRSMIRLFKAPAQLYFSLIQPLIWFLLFGQLFSRLTTGFGAGGGGQITGQFGTDNYSAFFLPAIIIQMMLFGSANSALGIITDDQSGYLNKLRVAPINRLAILVGNLLADLSRMLLQVLVLMVVGVLFGVRFEHPELIPLIFVISSLFGLMMGGLGLFVGLTTRNTQATFLVINFFTLPLIFTSSAQLPVALLPDWLQFVAKINPVTYAIDGLRAIVIKLSTQQVSDGKTVGSVIITSLIVLFVLMCLTLGAATWKFRKQVQ